MRGRNRMDKIDQNILSELNKDSTESFSKIAKKIGISPMPVHKRYNKMKKDGVIFGTTTMIDLSLLGYKGKAFLFIKYLSCKDPKTFKKKVMNIPNMFLFADIIGKYDALVMIVYRDTSEIKEICDKIRANKCVKQVKVAVSIDTVYPVKEEYLNDITKLLQP